MSEKRRKTGRRVQSPADAFIGKRLRYFRQARDISQEKLGSIAGMTFQQIQKYEKGTNRISAGVLWEFSKILETPIQDFFSGLETKASDDGEITPLNFKILKHHLANDPETLRKVLAYIAAIL